MDCFETKNAKIFCEIFSRVTFTNLDILQNIFWKYWNFSDYFIFRTKVYFLSKSSFSGFSCLKTYVYIKHKQKHIIHVKKTCIKSIFPLRRGAGGQGPSGRGKFFYVLREDTQKGVFLLTTKGTGGGQFFPFRPFPSDKIFGFEPLRSRNFFYLCLP